MNKVITDVFVWDQLPEGYDKSKLAYDLDEGWESIYRLSLSGVPEKLLKPDILDDKKVVRLPMFALEEPMPKQSYQKIPKQAKTILETFIVAATSNKIAIESKDMGWACRAALDELKKEELTIAIMLYSAKKLSDNKFLNSLAGNSLWSLPINGLEENELLFVADAEFVGALAVSHDHSEIGMFMLANNIVKVKIVP